VLLRIPSFNVELKAALDSLLAANHTRLISTPLLIIDIRGNGWGGDVSFSELIPLLYTNPIREVGTDVLASDDNIGYFRGLLDRPELPPSVKATVADLVRRADASRGRFVPFEDQVITRDSVYPEPRIVAILIDSGVASAAEQFLLQAKQSRKVVLFGSGNTAGIDDYANVRLVELPSRLRRAGIPTSRSRRLPGAPVDPYGIAPDVRVPENLGDLVSYVRGYYRAR
jgi:C-terminal processing protease CtpA/Prc